MPIEVDLDKRLRAIAEATLELASEAGPRAVTVRAVANRLGGSTTLVTGFLPSRQALLGNAFRFVNEGWEEEIARALEGKSGFDRVRALAQWSLQTVNFDDAIRRLWMESLSGAPRGSVDEGIPLGDEADEEHRIIAETVSGAGQPDWLTDLLYLAFRGYYVSSIENPGEWTPERAFNAVNQALNLAELDPPGDIPGAGRG